MTSAKRNASIKNLGTCLVTGGAGLLGFALVKLLRAEGLKVRVLDQAPFEGVPGVDAVMADVRDSFAVEYACSGVQTVFHTAAAVWNPSTPKEIFEAVNVQGTRNVINACRKHKVPRLVFTSTLDVVVDGRIPITNGDEALPYPDEMPADPYSRTKIISEKEVIAANGGNGLLTCSLRPVGMYGPRDRYHLPNIIKMANSRFNIRLGDGSARFSHVYSENAAHAHILAAHRLVPGSPVCGQCYFICDHQPADNLFTFMEPFLQGLGLPLPGISLPYRLAYALAWLSEKANPRGLFTRFAVVQTCVDHTFVHDRARRDFGYDPIVSKDEAFKKTMKWLSDAGYGRPN